VERYQCSFCHNRFLSRSITIRHISFHHKLKIKFCQSMDPTWTIDKAVWSDDSFELNVNKPQFLKVNKKKVNKDKGSNNSAVAVATNSEANHHVDSAHAEGVSDKYVITVSLQPPERDTAVHTKTAETVHDDSPSERNEQLSIHTVSSVNRNDTKDNITSVGHDIPSASSFSNITADEGTPLSDVASEGDNASTTTKTAGVKEVLETSGNSLLFCSICAMQFRGVSSLRYHLRKVHKITVHQSDLSSWYSSSTQNNKHQTKADTQVQTVNQNSENNKEKVSIEKTGENGTVRVAGCNDSKKHVNESPELSVSHVCPVCSEKFSSKICLSEHLKSHSEEDVESVGLHRCDICTSVMKNTQQVTKHIIKVHGVKQIFVCSICNREFYQQSSVYRHMKFLHKWEIKIRGEACIPVFVKPAPLSMHSPIKNTVGLRVRRDSSEDIKSPAAKQNIGADDVTYISLGTGGVEKLQVYKIDGQEVVCEVVDCDGTMTTLTIHEGGSDTVEAEARLLEAIQKALSSSSETETLISRNDEQLSSTQESRLVSGKAKAVLDTTTVTTEDGEDSFHTEATTSDSSTNLFVIEGDDQTTQFSATKEFISHLFAALKHTAQEKKANSPETSQVIRVKNVKQSHRISEPDAVSVGGVFNETTESKNTLETSEAVPQKKSVRLSDPAHVKPPIIMSVRDIGATFANCGARPGHRNTSESDGSKTSSSENTNVNLLSASEATEDVSKGIAKKLQPLAGIKTEPDKNKVRNSHELEESGKNVQNLKFATGFPGRIKEEVDVKLQQNSDSELLKNKNSKKSVSGSAGSESSKTRKIVPVARTQSKHGVKERVDVGLKKSDKTIKQKLRKISPTKQKVTKTSDISHKSALSEFIQAGDNLTSSVSAKVKGSRSSVQKPAFNSKLTTQSAPSGKKMITQSNPSCKRTSTQFRPSDNRASSYVDMPHPTVDKNVKPVAEIKSLEKSATTEPALVHRSSSGRIIKRKRFDDEI
ncbi:unnamed protein product, partial [Candidula unifasciata]